MNNEAHSATGVLAGVLATLILGPLTGLEPTVATVVMGGLVGAGAALLPDLDHDGSTATRSGGWLTRGLAESLQAASRATFRATRTAHDQHSEGEHRYLLHTPAFALLVGGFVAGGQTVTRVVSDSTHHALHRWVLAALVWLCLAAALRSLAWSLPSALRRTTRLHHRIPAAVFAAAGTYLLVWWGSASAHLCPLLGACVAAGMIAHDLGDAATHSGIPLAWPLRLHGQRWRRLGLPRRLRFTTGSAVEHVVQWLCLVTATAIGCLLAA